MQSDENSWWSAALGASIVAVLALVVALSAVGGWNWTASFLSGAAANWAQAVGTVAAIVYSGRIARTQIVATRRLDESKRLQAEVRHLTTVVALLSTPISLCLILRQHWNRATHQIPNGFNTSYWEQAQASIAAIDPFSCPDETLVVRLVQVPRQIEELIEACRNYLTALEAGAQIEQMAGELDRVLGDSIEYMQYTAHAALEAGRQRSERLAAYS